MEATASRWGESSAGDALCRCDSVASLEDCGFADKLCGGSSRGKEEPLGKPAVFVAQIHDDIQPAIAVEISAPLKPEMRSSANPSAEYSA